MSARVVGWTVGPRYSNVRLKRIWGLYYFGSSLVARSAICVYATRDDALAAGSAYARSLGYYPADVVARRVVRRTAS